MLAIGLVAASLFGFGVTRLYDRKGLHRILPEVEKPTQAAVRA
jgi:hypothetical protein